MASSSITTLPSSLTLHGRKTHCFNSLPIRGPRLPVSAFAVKRRVLFVSGFLMSFDGVEGVGRTETMSISSNDENVMQKHVAFFDRNGDGVIYPWETFQGFRAIGSGLALSTFGAVFINLALSGNTRPGKFPNLLFPIEVGNIAKAKHGSDTGVYDTEGRFVDTKFEEIFRKHALSNPNALTSNELSDLLKANREPKDFGGWVAAWTEWKILYYLCKDKNGLLQKETIRAAYDGSLFERMEKEKLSSDKSV